MRPHTLDLPNGRIWLRVADPEWPDPLDASHAERSGGRWVPPGSFRTLYLNANPETARLQLDALLRGSPIRVEDLDDDAYVLVAATLPRDQTCADALSDAGLQALDLPDTYPLDGRGQPIARSTCQPIGQEVKDLALRGIVCRSACTADGRGRELAWFPATSRSDAHPFWDKPLQLGKWRDAATWGDVGLPEQGHLQPAYRTTRAPASFATAPRVVRAASKPSR